MTSTLEIETLSDDNGKSHFRSQRFKVNGKEITTPFRTIDLSKMPSGAGVHRNAQGAYEIYRKLKSAKVQELIKDPAAVDDYGKQIHRLVSRADSGYFRICFVRYDETSIPTETEVEQLTDISHGYSDITPIPSVDFSITQDNFKDYMGYVNSAYKKIEELNKKPIMGVVPIMPRSLYQELFDFYSKAGITAFYLDFSGKTPNPLQLRPIQKTMERKKLLESSLLYILNAGYGRALKNADVLPAKDFGAYGLGTDALGGSHIFPKRPKEFYERMKLIGGRKENAKRLFMKDDYGYHKVASLSALEPIYPKETGIDAHYIFSAKTSDWQKLFNMEQQAIEAGKLRKLLVSLDKKESILDYISKKEQIKGEIGHYRISNDSKQSKLFID